MSPVIDALASAVPPSSADAWADAEPTLALPVSVAAAVAWEPLVAEARAVPLPRLLSPVTVLVAVAELEMTGDCPAPAAAGEFVAAKTEMSPADALLVAVSTLLLPVRVEVAVAVAPPAAEAVALPESVLLLPLTVEVATAVEPSFAVAVTVMPVLLAPVTVPIAVAELSWLAVAVTFTTLEPPERFSAYAVLLSVAVAVAELAGFVLQFTAVALLVSSAEHVAPLPAWTWPPGTG
jgi:hypothetical protein